MKFSFGPYDKRSVGLIGFILFSLFNLLCIFRLYLLAIKSLKCQINMRVLFLVMSVLGAFFDGLYFLMMVIHDKYTLVGYNFHMLGMFFSAMAFIAVVFRWNKALQIHSKSSTLTKISYLLVVGNCLVTLVAIIDSLMARNYDEYLKRWSYEAVATTNCSTIFLYSSGLYFYARYVRSKLIVSGRDSLYNVSSLEYEVHRTQLLRKLFKMNVVLGVCSACYFLRVVCLGMVLVDIERDETTTDSISLYWWFTLSLWIPSLGSGLILLYTMRENKEKHFSDGQMLRIANESSAEASERQNSKFSSSYYSCESTDSTPDFNNDDSAECLDVRLPLISDDCADIAFQYETTSHMQRYRHEVGTTRCIHFIIVIVCSLFFSPLVQELWEANMKLEYNFIEYR